MKNVFYSIHQLSIHILRPFTPWSVAELALFNSLLLQASKALAILAKVEVLIIRKEGNLEIRRNTDSD